MLVLAARSALCLCTFLPPNTPRRTAPHHAHSTDGAQQPGGAAQPPPNAINGAALGDFLQQLQQLPAQPTGSQATEQQQQQPEARGGLPDSLQALLGHPDMLTAAILSGSGAGGGAVGAPPPLSASAADAADMLAAGEVAAAAAAAAADADAMMGDLGFDLSNTGFADEGDDAYDPTADD